MPLYIACPETSRLYHEIEKVILTSEDMTAITTALLLCVAHAIVAKSKVHKIPAQQYFTDHSQYLASIVQALELDVTEMEKNANVIYHDSKYKM